MNSTSRATTASDGHGRSGRRVARSVDMVRWRGWFPRALRPPRSMCSSPAQPWGRVGLGTEVHELDESFAEYRTIGVADPLRQGDVIEATDMGASMWHRHLLVITADCDFAHAKHQGRVTCVPLLRAEEYLAEMRVPRIREQLANQQLRGLREILSKAGAPTISDRRLREWPGEEEPSAIVVGLGLKQGDAQKATAALTAIRMLDAPTGVLKDALNSLVDAQLAGINPPKRESATKNLIKSLRDTYAQPPGDALFLSAIGPGIKEGYFAYLRHIEQILEPEISLGSTRRAVQYRRISRLQDRFRMRSPRDLRWSLCLLDFPTNMKSSVTSIQRCLGKVSHEATDHYSPRRHRARDRIVSRRGADIRTCSFSSARRI